MSSTNQSDINNILEVIRECIIDHDYINCICWLFGISIEMSEHDKMREFLHGLWQQLEQAKKSKCSVSIKDSNRWLDALRDVRKTLDENKQLWKECLRIVCSDDELRRIATQVKGEGLVHFSKKEFDQRFDFSSFDPFWCYIPDYAEVTIGTFGSGICISSPDQDMFRAMCRSHDEAVLSGIERDKILQQVTNWDPSTAYKFLTLNSLYQENVRQVIVNACLFVEAFVNSVAHTRRCTLAASLTPDQDRFLRERAIDKNTGAERDRFVSLQDKLHHWIKLVSPRGETFDKGTTPYQSFRTIQEYRDSIVHLSASKWKKYGSIDLLLAKKAVDVSIEIVEAICRYIAPNPSKVAYPNWLAKRKSDGLFNLLGSMKWPVIQV